MRLDEGGAFGVDAGEVTRRREDGGLDDRHAAPAHEQH